MKKIMKISLCFIFIMGLSIIFDLDKYKAEEFSISKTIKNLKDPAEVNYIKKIEINYDMDKVILSPAYTYLEEMSLFRNNWMYPDDARYDKGNNNVWFYYCPNNTICDYSEKLSIYDEELKYNYNVDKNRYHLIDVEVYAKDCDGGEFCVNDFDPEHLDEIEVWVNGVKRDDAKIRYYNDYWHSVDVVFPIEVYTGNVVKDIKVSSESSAIQKGTSSKFNAIVNSYGADSDKVVWSIIGANDAGTTIDEDGLLNVSNTEEDCYITVRATSAINNMVYGEKEVEIISVPLSIDSIKITNGDLEMVYGASNNYYAEVIGTANHDVIWSITGNKSNDTNVDKDGLLTISKDETAKSIKLTATSKYDNTKKDTIIINLKETEYIKKIEINYDTDKVVFSNRTTYYEVRSLLSDNWELPLDSGYGKGNNNVWLNYCNSSTRCEENFTYGNNEKMLTDRYTYAFFEIFAKPEGNNLTNPLYDFDEDNLDKIEIWVNGVKRDDAFIHGYNNAWRKVDVFVPITVSDEKLAQGIEFYYNEYETDYNSSPFINPIREQIGDGEVTFKSSDESVATVDNDGLVTVKKVGECTISATLNETDDYKEGNSSYTLIVNPQYIYPDVFGYDSESYYYTGEEIKPPVIVKYGEEVLKENIDYTVSYSNNIDSGYGRIYLNSVEVSNYRIDGDFSKSFYINRQNITDEDIKVNEVVYYDGTAKEPEIVITINGRKLIKGTDYSVSYSSNTNVGTGYAYISGINNYAGNPYITFEINEAPEYEKGDMDKNGKIGLSDVVYLLKVYLGVEEANDTDKIIGDMNNDRKISLQDIIMLLKKYLGVE